MKPLHIGVIGAGATGLAAAYKLARQGHEVTILEKNDELGGLAASIPVQGVDLERYYHHLFATDEVFINTAKELGLGDKLYFKQLPTGIYYKGEQYSFGTPAEMLRFKPIPLADRIRFAGSSAYLKSLKSYTRLEPVNALEWCRRNAGKQTTKVIWEPLLRNKFGEHADEISMAWLWARVHFRTFKLGYMRGGFDQVYVKLAESVKKHGGVIHFKQDIVKIEQRKSDDQVTVRLKNGKRYKFDRLISTMPQPVFAEAIGSAQKDDLWQARYLGATCFILELKRSITPYYWLNINDPDFPFLAVVEQTRLTDMKEYGDRHIVYVGNYLTREDRRFTTDPSILLKEYIPYHKQLNPDFKASDILKWHFSKAPFAQPIVTPDYHKHIPAHETPLPHVWLATMSQVYPQDRGQNYAFKMGYKVADMAIKAA